MDTKIIKFVDTKIKKHKLYCHKTPILTTNVNIIKIVVSNKVFFDKNGFYTLLVM